MKGKYVSTVITALVASTITLAYGHMLTLERFLVSALIIAVTVGGILGIIFLLRKAKTGTKKE